MAVESDFLTAEEMVKLGEVLRGPRSVKLHPHVVPCIILLVLTGCRKSEILKLRWSEVDLQNKYLYLSDSKTGARKIPLNDQSAQILANLPRQLDSDFAFPASKGTGHFTALQDGWEKVREAAGITDVHLHDLRHSFATALASNGSSLLMISKLLGHRDQRTTQIYAHLIDSSQHEASQIAAAALASIWNSKS